MILWFGKNKKKQELEEAGRAIEAGAGSVDVAEPEAATVHEPVAEIARLRQAPDLEAPLIAPDPGGPPEPEPPADEVAPVEGPRPDPAPDPAHETEPPADGQAVLEPAPAPEPEAAPQPDPLAETRKPGFLGRLTRGLSRSSSRLADGITGVFTRRKLDDETLEALEDLLISSDLGARVAGRVTASLARDRFDREVSDSEIREALASEVADVLRPRQQVVDFSDGPRPRVVLFVGVNGSGKTTTIGKIAARLQAEGAKALLVAGDTFRAAAIEQLTVWGERAGIPVMSKATGADAAGLVFEAVERARREGLDLVLVDTAGRLQNKSELMAELAKIVRVCRKLDAGAPHDVILVLDATVGQNALSQVEAFRHTAGVTGLVMTKLDGTAKGGVLVAIADAYDLPIHFVGVGERAEDLHPFSADAFARALVGLDERVA